MNFLKYEFYIFYIVQCQIGDNTIPRIFRILVFVYSTNTIFNLFSCITAFCLFNHFAAQIKSQHLYRPLLRRIFAMPSIATPQIENIFSFKRRK